MSPIPLSRPYKRIIQLELNELSKTIVDKLIGEGKLPHFKQITQEWQYYETTSEQKYEHIEPWIQWVTAHTGKTFAEHEIFHLGDAHCLQYPQVWEMLSTQHQLESCVFGSMNVTRGKAEKGLFFPDPWTKGGKTYPTELQPLWDLVSSKVQTHATQQLTVHELWRAFQSCVSFHLPLSLYAAILQQLIAQKLNPKKRWRLAGLFDVLLTNMFKKVVRDTDCAFYTLFLNSIAHYQHHFWRNFQPELFSAEINSPDCDTNDNPILYGYENYDRILGEVMKLSKEPDTLVIIASGFSQEPFTKEEVNGGMNYYRLRDHKAFAAMLGLNDCNIFPLMSRDWQIDTSAERLAIAEPILQKITVAGEPLFSVANHTERALFLETAITRSIGSDEMITDHNGKTLGRFHDHFCCTAVKSGSHIHEGSLWFSEPAVNASTVKQVPLTALFPTILSNFSG